jgi:hypothetical protein
LLLLFLTGEQGFTVREDELRTLATERRRLHKAERPLFIR